MDIPLIGLLLVLCLAALLAVRFFTKTAHVTEDAFITARPPLAPHECALLSALERSLPGTCRIFAKLRLSDIVVPSEKLSSQEQHTARRHADQFSLTFALCTQPQMKVIGVVVCEEQPGTGGDSAFIHKVLAANGIPLIFFKAKPEYYQLEVWVKLSEACPGLFEQSSPPTLKDPRPSRPSDQIAHTEPESPPASESSPTKPAVAPQQESEPAPAAPSAAQQSDARPCPACSGTMIRRQVMNGPHIGKFFLVCSNFPTCRQMVALPEAAEPSAPVEHPLPPSAPASVNPASAPATLTTPTESAPAVAVCSSSPANEPSAQPQTDSPVQPISTTKPILLTAAVTAQPVSAMPAAVPTVEPRRDQTCPACGKDMVKMQVAKGAHAGKFFWACSAYPACRQLAAVKD